MADILMEFEGLTKARTKTVMKKINHCGFNTLVTHLEVQCADFSRELTSSEQQQDDLDIQPIQANSIYIKCELLDSAGKYSGRGDAKHILRQRNQSPFLKLMAQGATLKRPSAEGTIATESVIEDEIEPFGLKVRKDIVFLNTTKSSNIGFYNAKSNILWISDLIHNPLRSEMLLDRAVSFVYEYQKVGSLNVITPVFEKYQKELEKRGLSSSSLWWTGFEDSKDTAYIDGKLDATKFLDTEVNGLIKCGVDIFFLRSLKKHENRMDISVDKCRGKVSISQKNYGEEDIQIPAHTTLETELKSIEKYVGDYASKIAKEFYEKAKSELDENLNK
jgi:hypothetical protein